ncbi:LOW QUALITY PROTEIN: putative olfactory receptor 2B8 [Trichechus inunguis]
MTAKNGSSFTGFVLLAFSDRPQLELVLYVVLFIFCIFTLLGNTTTILLSHLCPNLHTSMSFFLTNQFLDLCYSTNIVPHHSQSQGTDQSISCSGCVVQLYISLGLESTKCIPLGVMAFDHYAAVCGSLHYTVIMNPHLCALVASASWRICFANSLLQTVLIFLLPFCRRNKLDHLLCEVPPFFKLACVDITMNESELFFVSVNILLIPIVLTMFSYGQIVRAGLCIKSAAGQRKAFGTCGSHLIVFSLFYGTAIYAYLQSSKNYSHDQGEFISLFYTTIILMINPLMCTLWNKDMKGAFKKVLWKDYDSR